MQNKNFKDIITWILIASPLWWTSGCYSTREVTKPSEAVGDYLEVTSKAGKAYYFYGWTCDSTGSISGTAGSVKYEDPYYGWTTTRIQQRVTIPADSIATIQTKTKDEFAASLLVLALIYSAITLYLAISMHGAWFGIHF